MLLSFIMDIFFTIALVLWLLFFPQLAIQLGKKASWLSPILTCYAAGIVVGNSLTDYLNHFLLERTIEATVVLAIPLLLFGSDIKQWLKQPDKTIPAYALALLATVTASLTGFFIFSTTISNADQVASMLTGVYSGGTINMSAITVAFNFDQSLFLLLNGYDILFSSIYLLFIMSIAKPVLTRFLGKPNPLKTYTNEQLYNHSAAFSHLTASKKVVSALKAIGLAITIGGTSAGLSLLFFGELNTLFIIVLISLLGIAASLKPQIRNMPGTFEVGDYILLIFALAIGANANFDELIQSSGELIPMAFYIFSVSIGLHLLLCKIFKIDAITFLITSTAAIFGPPFIGPVATALKRKEWIIPGLTVAVIGNAAGTYLGIMVYQLLSN